MLKIFATIIAIELISIPYISQSVIPIARTIGIKYDISSSFFVLKPLIIWGRKPIDVIRAAVSPMSSIVVESI